jgi:hypothetical protein
MKKKIILLKTFLFLMLTMLFISCSTNADDIKLNDLKTSCDYVDAMNKIYEQMIKIKGDTKVNELGAEKKAEMEVWTKKMKEIALAASKKYTEAEVKECADFEKLKVNRDLLSDKKAELTDDDRKKMEERANLIVDSIAKAALINRP